MIFLLLTAGSELNVIATYITSYISKPDKTQNMSWRDVLRELDKEMHETVTDVDVDDVNRALHQDIYTAVKQFVGDREMTGQEAALEALGLPLIEYSSRVDFVQANRPEDTYIIARKKKHRPTMAAADQQLRRLTYDPHVTKYVLRK